MNRRLVDAIHRRLSLHAPPRDALEILARVAGGLSLRKDQDLDSRTSTRRSPDWLTIIAHDRFQEIVDEAERGESAIHLDVVVIGRDVPAARQETVTIPSLVGVAALAR